MTDAIVYIKSMLSILELKSGPIFYLFFLEIFIQRESKTLFRFLSRNPNIATVRYNGLIDCTKIFVGKM